ncbi:hypothetical protein, partial [Enterococcus sp. BWB1-3]|uniref:hypothetical protein n=1 Tax=Enterococcus sp. BWB1-3 TaxID=2787713 RepID=UPI001F25A1A5
NLRKLGKYMERKTRKKERTRSILMIIAKIERVFFLRTDYCPRLSESGKDNEKSLNKSLSRQASLGAVGSPRVIPVAQTTCWMGGYNLIKKVKYRYEKEIGGMCIK